MSKLKATAEVCKDITRLQFSHYLRIEVPFLSSGSLCLSNYLYSMLFLNSPFLHVLPPSSSSPHWDFLWQVVNKTFQPLISAPSGAYPSAADWKPQPFEVPRSSLTLAGSKGKPPSIHGASMQHPLTNSSCWASTHKLRNIKARWNCAAASNGMVFSNYLCKNSCFMCYFLILWHCLDPFPCVYIWFNLMDFGSFVPFWVWTIVIYLLPR